MISHYITFLILIFTPLETLFQTWEEDFGNVESACKATNKNILELSVKMKDMTGFIDRLEEPVHNVKNVTNEVLIKTKRFQDELRQSAASTILEGVDEFVDLIKAFAEQYINHVMDVVSVSSL